MIIIAMSFLLTLHTCQVLDEMLKGISSVEKATLTVYDVALQPGFGFGETNNESRLNKSLEIQLLPKIVSVLSVSQCTTTELVWIYYCRVYYNPVLCIFLWVIFDVAVFCSLPLEHY